MWTGGAAAWIPTEGWRSRITTAIPDVSSQCPRSVGPQQGCPQQLQDVLTSQVGRLVRLRMEEKCLLKGHRWKWSNQRTRCCPPPVHQDPLEERLRPLLTEFRFRSFVMRFYGLFSCQQLSDQSSPDKNRPGEVETPGLSPYFVSWLTTWLTVYILRWFQQRASRSPSGGELWCRW